MDLEILRFVAIWFLCISVVYIHIQQLTTKNKKKRGDKDERK